MDINNKDSLFKNIIHAFSKIPTLGRRSAQRMTYHLATHVKEELTPLIEQLTYLRDHIQECEKCNMLCFSKICSICADPQRDKQTICIVEKPQNVEAIEQSGFYKGQYHILGGTLSMFHGTTSETLNINSLKKRLEGNNQVKEIICALPATQEGTTTLHYLSDILTAYPLTISTPAQGIPLGGALEYLDQGTLITAFNSRKTI